MLDVQHLVIKDVLYEPLGHVRRVERLTDRDAVVDMVVMTEDALRPPL